MIFTGGSSICYVKLYDATSVTVGTTTPLMTIFLPTSGNASAYFVQGLAFSNAIQIAVTTNMQDIDIANPGTQITVNVFYK